MPVGPRKPSPPAGVEPTSRNCSPASYSCASDVCAILCSRAQASRARRTLRIPDPRGVMQNYPELLAYSRPQLPAGPIVVEFSSTVVRGTHSGEKMEFRCKAAFAAPHRGKLPTFQLSRCLHLARIEGFGAGCSGGCWGVDSLGAKARTTMTDDARQ